MIAIDVEGGGSASGRSIFSARAVPCLFLLFWLLCLGPGVTQAREWFEHLEPSRAEWQLEPSSRSAWVRQIEPRRTLPEDRQRERILVLFPKPSPTYDTAMARILRAFALRDRWPSFTLVHYRHATRSSDRKPRRLQQYLARAERGAFDLVFAMGSVGAEDLHRNYRQGSVPVVTVGAKDPVLLGLIDAYEGGSKTNIAYTSLNVPIASQLAYLRQIRPGLRQIAVVYSKRNRSAVATQVEPLREAAHASGVTVLDVAVDNPRTVERDLGREMAKAVLSMQAGDPDRDRSLFWITGSTVVFSAMDVVLEEASGFPVLAVSPSLVHGGRDSALLAIGVSFESNADLAAVYALRILDGQAEPGALDVGLVLPPDVAINMHAAQELRFPIPFSVFETAGVIYDYEGRQVRADGRDKTVETGSENGGGER